MAKLYPPLRNQRGARALLLPRVSSAKQAEEGTSLQSQEHAMRVYAAEHKYVVVDCVPDTFTGTDLYRPALNTARKQMREGRIDVILVYAYDRFFRDQVYQTVFLHECRQQGVAVESVTEQLDESQMGRMTTTILGIIAEFEREKLIERTRRGMRERVESGRLKAGPIPLYGYRWHDGARGGKRTHDAYKIDWEVADTILWIYEQVLQSVSLHQIARQLNAQGVLTPAWYLDVKGQLGRLRKGYGHWTYQMVRHIVINPTYMGKHRAFAIAFQEALRVDDITGKSTTVVVQTRKPEEETVVLPDSTCPAIIDEARWAKAQTMVAHKGASFPTGRRDREATLLSRGHVFCGHCLRPAVTLSRQRSAGYAARYRYACRSSASNCPDPRLQCSHRFTLETRIIDQQVWDAVRALIKQDLEAGGNPLQALAERELRSQAEMHAAVLSTLQTTRRFLKQKIAERKQLECAFRDAMRREYDETRVASLQLLLNSTDLEIANLEKSQHESTIHAHTCQEDLSKIQLAVKGVSKLCEDLDNADWMTKRRLLYLLGVKVFVYHTGTNADGQGHRWRVHYDWGGLEELLKTEIAVQVPELG